MDKKQAEEIITSSYKSLLSKLHTQTDFNPWILVHDLHHLAKALQTGENGPIKLHEGQHQTEEKYKAIAKESLDSYAQTKESVERINQEQKRLIEASIGDSDIEVDEVVQNFNKSSSQIEEHMKNATETIQALHKQIKLLEKASNLDPLTRVFNRRALEQHLLPYFDMKQIPTDRRIILVDIDDFKEVNDTYGHLAGDRVLIFLGKLISSSLRDGDKVFRFGGEEFLISLSRSDDNTCEKVAERILKGVRANTLLYKEHQIKITLSMGAAQLQENDTYESFLERADKALYQAKANGKDQIVTG